MPKRNLVVVAGNIGAGKTTFAQKVGQELGWEINLEKVGENPYLHLFYEKMSSWAFHLQVENMQIRANAEVEARQSGKNIIFDRSRFEDFEIFTKALAASGNMGKNEFATISGLYHLLGKMVPPPTLLVYLKVTPEEALKRIQKRGRKMEKEISLDYLSLLGNLYEVWARDFNLCPVLLLDSHQLNLEGKKENILSAARMLKESLV